VHEDHRTLGIGAEIAAIAAEQAFRLPGCADCAVDGAGCAGDSVLGAALEKFYLPSVDKIVEAATKLLNY
jgi:pyruvate/2-oxoglutarate/acetoin dehydrogenase E1 component